MRATYSSLVLLAAALLGAAPAAAQQNGTRDPATEEKKPASTSDTVVAAPAPAPSLVQPIVLQRYRPTDQRGINMFEAPKTDDVPFTGFKLAFGAAFTQQFQGLSHSNNALPKPATDANGKPYNANSLIEMGSGFNTAAANLYVNAQLAPGIRVAMTTYLSSRHHNEAWVKDGYLLVDDSPIDVAALKTLMKYMTLRAGHFEINYGDAHFRRSDNGNAMQNPFVGNLIMDAFTTEVGAEVYFRAKGLMAMGAVTGGEIKGNVLTPNDRAPAFIGKLGFDRQMTDDVRVRLTGSMYTNSKSPGGTLFAGDRAGSRYFFVVENPIASSTAQASSGLINPQFRRSVTSYQINPFVKVKGLELFGVIENASGKNSATEVGEREWNQYAAEAVYRFLPGEKLFVGGRYNTAKGELVGMSEDVTVRRSQLGAGWFVTPSILVKGEYVTQKYHDFPFDDIRRGAKFNGFMMEGVVSF